ncbi:MAG: DUF5343 domain-containing protein [Vulcanimicrobiaceae bacterium]|jgi:hypothetical protein
MEQDTNFKPYAAPENIVRILQRVRKGGVKRVDPDFMRQIGIGDGMIPRTHRALNFLGFTDNDGVLTPLFERYVVASDEEAKQVLAGALRTAYEVIFRAADPSTDDRAKIHTAFRTASPSGQWGRMVTLFLGLCVEAGIPVKEPPTNRPAQDAAAREKISGRPKKTPSAPRKTQQYVPPPPQDQPMNGRLDPALAGIVAKIPDIETADDLERWWQMFKPAFLFVKKINA